MTDIRRTGDLFAQIRAERRARARELTDRQYEIAEFMRTFQRDRGMPPTMREIAEAFGWASTNGVAEQLRVMENKGAVEHRGKINASRCWFALPPTTTMGDR